MTGMQDTSAPSSTEFIVLPEVMLGWVYLLCLHLWTIWRMATMKFAPLASSTGEAESIRFLTGGEYAVISSLDALFFVAFVLAGLRARRSPHSLRKGHLFSVSFGAVTVVLVQLASHRLYGPIELL
jgi:hypothetical protein